MNCCKAGNNLTTGDKPSPPDFAQDLENWMTKLPPSLRQLPLIYLAIPGSHDSMTFGMTRQSHLSPDAEPVLKRLATVGGPLTRWIMYRWSKTQSLSIMDQLKNGIRYFDLRLATKGPPDSIYAVHGLYCEDLYPVLDEIKGFLDQHQNEVVILDCQHFYSFTIASHAALMERFVSVFGQRLLPHYSSFDSVTLDNMSRLGHQVMIIYRNGAAKSHSQVLWPGSIWPTPWPNTMSVPDLLKYLQEGLHSRDRKLGFVTQLVLTPSAGYVALRLFSSLKSKCVGPLIKDDLAYRWLEDACPGKDGGVNVVIGDLVGDGKGMSRFATIVVGLNGKLVNRALPQSAGLNQPLGWVASPLPVTS